MEKRTRLADITELNKVDWIILVILLDRYIEKKKITVGELTKKVEIAPVNVWKHLKKLKEMDFIISPEVKKGKKKFVYFNDEVRMEENQRKLFIKFIGGILEDLYKK